MNNKNTKSYLTQRCKDILHNNDGIIDNYFLLNTVFPMHPEWEQKKGQGVKDISIRLTKYGNKCFMIQRVDGTFTDISYTKCITNPSKIFQVKAALRSAIRPIIEEFKGRVSFGEDKCIFTKEILTHENTHIDHVNLEFNELANIFIEQNGLDYLYKDIAPSKDNMIDIYFSTPILILMFRDFHNKNTHLRAITKKANLSSKIRNNEHNNI
jgi:hypothetical protein